MIQFSLTLSVNQIACLRAIEAMTDRGDTRGMIDISYWASGVRLLLSEKFVTWTDVRVTARDMKEVEKQMNKSWQITEKGRLVLRIIEMDIADAAAEINAKTEALTAPRPRKQVAAGKEG